MEQKSCKALSPQSQTLLRESSSEGFSRSEQDCGSLESERRVFGAQRGVLQSNHRDELRRELLAIKGVGDYAAATLLMLLGRYDCVPVDSWALSCVSKEWHDGRPVSKQEVEAAFECWGPYKGLAYWFWDWTHRKAAS